MSKQPDKELREAIKMDAILYNLYVLAWLDGVDGEKHAERVNVTISELDALFTKAQLQLVDELLAHEEKLSAYPLRETQPDVIEPKHEYAIPFSVLQQYKANLSGKGE